MEWWLKGLFLKSVPPVQIWKSSFFATQTRWGISNGWWNYQQISRAIKTFQLFPMPSARALTDVEVNYGWSLNVDTGHVSIILRGGCIGRITSSPDGIMLKYFSWGHWLPGFIYITAVFPSGIRVPFYFVWYNSSRVYLLWPVVSSRWRLKYIQFYFVVSDTSVVFCNAFYNKRLQIRTGPYFNV